MTRYTPHIALSLGALCLTIGAITLAYTWPTPTTKPLQGIILDRYAIETDGPHQLIAVVNNRSYPLNPTAECSRQDQQVVCTVDLTEEERTLVTTPGVITRTVRIDPTTPPTTTE